MVVDVYESELHLLFLLAVVFIKFHLGKEELSIVIVLDLEVSSLRHIANDFSRNSPSFCPH